MVTITYEEIPDDSGPASKREPLIQRCVLTRHAGERVQVLLLPGGLFVPDPTSGPELPSDDLIAALVHVILAHGEHDGESGPTDKGSGARLPGWPDLPAVICTHARVSCVRVTMSGTRLQGYHGNRVR